MHSELRIFCAFCWLCAQKLYADLCVYKDQNGIVTFTNVPTHTGYRRVLRDNEQAQTKPELVRNTKTGEIGYWDGEKVIPLWPEQYTKLEKNTALVSPNEYEDIWVEGLSEQTGAIKMRKGMPVHVAAVAIDWLIKHNPDKYRPRITSRAHVNPSTKQPGMNSYRPGLFILAFVILFAPLLTFYFKDRYRTLVSIPFLIRRGILKYALSRRCRHCKARTENQDRVCDVCQRRIDNEKIKAQEHNKREREPQNPPDPHQVPGVATGASKEEIKAAYLNLIKKYHPDKVSHLGHEFQKIAEEKSEAINRAYQILTSR